MTITREQQKQILIDTANHVISRDNTSPYSENLRELARIALASLTAKPIAHTSQYGIDRMIRDNAGLLVQAHGGNAYEIPLYTTPPAPIVPDAISTRQAISKMEECEPCDSINVAYKYGWNACRATMLQAGWVIVPVEPTDEMIAAAMECDDVVFDSKDPTAFCVQFREIYCAMVDAALALNKGEY
ncbi:TPA: hypothetical protein ACIBPO_002477 [Salmonella enterica subsp. enterica serovar Havana]|nr:hypothetical protein [Salmonella enterica]